MIGTTEQKSIKVGDIVEIIDQEGADYGQIGDLGVVTGISNTGSSLSLVAEVDLLTGKDIGMHYGRYFYRLKKVQSEWDT